MRTLLPKRVLAVIVAALVATGAGILVLQDDQRGSEEESPTLEEMARAVGFPVMQLLVRGHVPERSGDIMLVPKPNHFMISDWDLRTLGTDDPEIKTTHPQPWGYLTRVPLVVRGPGIPEGLKLGRPVDISQIAPTYARILGMDDFASPTCSLEEVVACDSRGGWDTPPRAIVTVVLDGGGWNVLDRYPDAWPNIRRLMDQGVSYDGATIGSAPSTTGALHATFGTGFYPDVHGIPGNVLRTDEGEIVDVFFDKKNDTSYLVKPTVSELWDERNDNEAVVATVSYENWHLGMIGHGALRETGDKDIAVLWDRERAEWYVNEEYFELPEYLDPTDRRSLRAHEKTLDARDGRRDGRWFDQDIDEILSNKNTRPSTPAFTRFTGDAVLDVIRNEDIGRDEITDLLWVELKPPDSAGHAWNVLNPEVEDVVAATDEQVGRIVDLLDRILGRDGYVFTLSSDHGQQPLPDDIGGWRINTSELELDIVARFGDVLTQATPADLYLDAEGLEAEGVTVEEVARWLGRYTVGENIPEGRPGRHLVPEERLDDTIYAAAFTSEFLVDPTLDITRLGTGSYGVNGRFPVLRSSDE